MILFLKLFLLQAVTTFMLAFDQSVAQDSLV